MPVEGATSRGIGRAEFLSSLAAVTIAIGTIAYFQGDIEVTNKVVFPSAGSGIVFTAGTFDHRMEAIPQTATGGNAAGVANATYDTFVQVNPFAGTGYLLGVGLFLDDNPTNLSFDCTFSKAAKSATGGYVFIDNLSGTGRHLWAKAGSGSTARGGYFNSPFVWHSGDRLKCATRGTLPVTASTLSGSMIYEAMEFPGR